MLLFSLPTKRKSTQGLAQGVTRDDIKLRSEGRKLLNKTEKDEEKQPNVHLIQNGFIKLCIQVSSYQIC